MLRVGLTGGIGSGKTTVAAMFAELGAVVVDADEVAREVVAVGTPGLRQVVDRFGTDILRPDGSLDRPELGRRVFADPQALAALNAIVHPLVGARTAELVDQAAGAQVLIHDVPLLVENGLQDGYDAVVVVLAPVELREERLAERGLPADEARARMSRQANDDARRAVATEVLCNDGSVSQLRDRVRGVWQRLTGAPAG
jgi:dephospho-CoA kinase